jgi:DUF4097 and DUF4098 domain-containing protein YvlB
MTPWTTARFRRVVWTAALPLLVPGCVSSFGDVHETIHRTVSAGASPAVRLENVAGTVQVDAWHRSDVDVVATKYGHDAQALRAVTIDVHADSSEVSIVTNYTGGTQSGGVRYRVHVPDDASLHVGNVVGAVNIRGVRGNIRVETQAGEITADLGKVAGDRSIDLRATTGAIALWISPESSAAVEASSTVGAFASNLPGVRQTRENLVGARASGTIGSGSGRIRLATTTGAIAIRQRPI